MTTVATKSRFVLEGRARSAGFTLIELMIAMLLGLIVIAGVTSVFLAGQQSFRTNDALAEVQDSSRVAFELMARDIREAGLTGCNSINGNLTNLLNNSSTAWWANWANAVHGYDNAAVDPALTGLGTGTPVAGTSSLELVSAGGGAVAISALYDDATSGNEITLNAPVPGLAAGDVVLLCTAGHAALFQSTSYSSSARTLSFDLSGNPGNGNGGRLGYPPGQICSQGPVPEPYADPAIFHCFPANSMISRLTAVDWYIGQNADGGTSLYRVSLQNRMGVPTPTTEEMVRNVTGMTITYLNRSLAGALGTSFQTGAVIAANNGWGGVTSMNVTLTIASGFKRANVTGDKPVVRKYSFVTKLRNRMN